MKECADPERFWVYPTYSHGRKVPMLAPCAV